MDDIEHLWREVEQRPDDAGLKLMLAKSIALEPGNADTDEPTLNLVIGLKWAASRGKHPRLSPGSGSWHWHDSAWGAQVWNLPDTVFAMFTFDERRAVMTLPAAFAALGKALRELRELVKE